MSTTTLPRWQLSSIFPSLESGLYQGAKVDLEVGISQLEADWPLPASGAVSGPLDDARVSAVESALTELNRLLTIHSDLLAFLTGLASTDAFDDRAQAELSGLQPLVSRLKVLGTRFTAAIGGIDTAGLMSRSAVVASHRFRLERAKVEANHLMTPEAEELAASLNISSGRAWSTLHGDLISRTTIERRLPGNGGPERYTLSQLQNLQYEPSRELRRAAYLAEIDLLEGNAVSFAAALNGIKGQVDTLSRSRGWGSPLDQALHQAGITREALNALRSATQENFPVFRRYLRVKAKLLGLDALAWYDLLAPVGRVDRRYSWDQVKALVLEPFRAFDVELARFSGRAFEQDWIDVPPRLGKQNGAFCMAVPGRSESRILLNFGGSLDDVFILAHELGHGYHNWCLDAACRTYLQSSTPMTLAETASTFCETLVVNAMLERTDDRERLLILDQDLLGTTQLILDIDSRFRFERAIFSKRRERDLSIEEFKEIMLDCQAATYGEALAEDERHPLMWAHKSHYYLDGLSFYNFPYTFGHLFALGLFAEYRCRPDGFADRYADFLSRTGMDSVQDLATEFGIDIEDPEFWRSSLAIAAERVELFERLAGML